MVGSAAATSPGGGAISGISSVFRLFPFTLIAVASNLVLLAAPLLLSHHVLEENVALRLSFHALVLPAYLPRLTLVVIAVQVFDHGPPPEWFGTLVPVLAIAPFLLFDLARTWLASPRHAPISRRARRT